MTYNLKMIKLIKFVDFSIYEHCTLFFLHYFKQNTALNKLILKLSHLLQYLNKQSFVHEKGKMISADETSNKQDWNLLISIIKIAMFN